MENSDQDRVELLMSQYSLAQERIAAAFQAFWQSTATVAAFSGVVAAAVVFALTSDQVSNVVRVLVLAGSWFVATISMLGLVALTLTARGVIGQAVLTMRRIEFVLDLRPVTTTENPKGYFNLERIAFVFILLGVLFYVVLTASLLLLGIYYGAYFDQSSTSPSSTPTPLPT